MRLKSFDGLELSRAGAEIGNPLQFKTAFVELPGMAGAFDAYGSEQVRQALTLDYKGLLVRNSAAEIDGAIDSLRAKANRGLRWLVAVMRDGSERGCWAKLTKIDDKAKPEDILSQEIGLTFEVAWPWWEVVSDIWYLDAGKVLDAASLVLDPHYTGQSGAGTVAINNDGGDRITRGLLVIKGASTEPKVENTTTGEWVQYGGSLGSSDTLVIDIGAQTARVGGLNVWSDITIGDMQTRIFSLAVGANSIVFSGGGTLEIHWARVY